MQTDSARRRRATNYATAVYCSTVPDISRTAVGISKKSMYDLHLHVGTYLLEKLPTPHASMLPPVLRWSRTLSATSIRGTTAVISPPKSTPRRKRVLTVLCSRADPRFGLLQLRQLQRGRGRRRRGRRRSGPPSGPARHQDLGIPVCVRVADVLVASTPDDAAALLPFFACCSNGV